MSEAEFYQQMSADLGITNYEYGERIPYWLNQMMEKLYCSGWVKSASGGAK